MSFFILLGPSLLPGLCCISAWEEEMLVSRTLFHKAAATGTVAAPVCRGKGYQLFAATSAVQFFLGTTPDIWIGPVSCQFSPYVIQGFNTQASLDSKYLPPCFISAAYYNYQEQVYDLPIILNQILKTNTIEKGLPGTRKIISILKMTKQWPWKPRWQTPLQW